MSLGIEMRHGVEKENIGQTKENAAEASFSALLRYLLYFLKISRGNDAYAETRRVIN